MKKNNSLDDIKIISKKELFQSRIENININLLYVIIGFLNEYFGGYNVDGEIVDRFFTNEIEKMNIFKIICEKYLYSECLKNDVKIIENENNRYVESTIISEKLKENFIVGDVSLGRKIYRLSDENDLFKKLKKQDAFNPVCYSYLLGIILRNKLSQEFKLSFANASHKAQIAIEILKELENFGDFSFDVKYFFATPFVTEVTLSSDNIVWKKVERLKVDLLTNN